MLPTLELGRDRSWNGALALCAHRYEILRRLHEGPRSVFLPVPLVKSPLLAAVRQKLTEPTQRKQNQTSQPNLSAPNTLENI